MKIGMDVYVEDMPRQAQLKSWLKPNHSVGYFRDCYNSYSLANWLSQNIDPHARGDWGLEIFDRNRGDFNTQKWREELLNISKEWLIKAHRLKGKTTYVGYPSEERIALPLKRTEEYIEWLEELVKFADLIYQRRATVKLWA
jgi:hypothetical protein